MKKTYRTRRLAVVGIISALVIGTIGAVPTKQERVLKGINRDMNSRVSRVENIIEGVEVAFNENNKELSLNISINPIEADPIKGIKAKDLTLYESKELGMYALSQLNDTIKATTGDTLNNARITTKVYNKGFIYHYSIYEEGKIRNLK